MKANSPQVPKDASGPLDDVALERESNNAFSCAGLKFTKPHFIHFLCLVHTHSHTHALTCTCMHMLARVHMYTCKNCFCHFATPDSSEAQIRPQS